MTRPSDRSARSTRPPRETTAAMSAGREAAVVSAAAAPVLQLRANAQTWVRVKDSSGRVVLDGDPVFDGKWLRSDLRRLRLDKIGFIFQAHNLLPFLTAAENVSLVLDLAGWAPEKGKERAKELLDYLEVGHRAPVKPALLSGGEAQRVAIARALANRPRIILADEPTAALDSKRAQLVMDLLRKLAAEQEACILTVTHDEKIFDRFDRLIHLRDGKLADE